MSSVAVLALGAMGSRIADRLLGCRVSVWNRSSAKANRLLQRGADLAAAPAEAAAKADVLITMLSGPDALAAISEGCDGIAAGAHRSAREATRQDGLQMPVHVTPSLEAQKLGTTTPSQP